MKKINISTSYMKLLDCLAKHFPIQEKGIKINFTWQDFIGKKRAGGKLIMNVKKRKKLN